MKLINNTIVYLVSNILNASIPFLLLPFLTRILTPIEYGAIAMFSVMVSIFSAFTGLSVNSAIGVRYFQLDKQDLAHYISACIGILIISTTFVLIIVILLNTWLVRLSGISIDWLIVAVIISGFQFLINIRLSIWQTSKRPWHYGCFQISRSLLDALLSLLLILTFSFAWQGRLIGQSVVVVLLGTVSLGWLYKDKHIRLSGTWKRHTLDALSFGIPVIPHVLGGLLMVTVDRIIITNLLGKESVGIYMVALQISQALGILTESFNKAYVPWLFNHLSNSTTEKNYRIVKGSYLYFLSIISIAIILGLVAPYVIRNIAGQEFWPASYLVIYLSLGFAFGGCYYVVVNYIFFQGKTQYLFIVTLLSGLLNIPMTYFLVKQFGIIGAAISFLIVKILSFLGSWILSHKLHPMPWFQIKFLTKTLAI